MDGDPSVNFPCKVCQQSLETWAPATRLERTVDREDAGELIRWIEPGYCHPEHAVGALGLGWRIVAHGILRDLDRERRAGH